MPEELRLNNGSVIQGHAQEMEDLLFLYMYGITMADAFALLIEPENTMRIVENRSGTEIVHEGFGHLTSVREETGGMISAGIKRGVVENG